MSRLLGLKGVSRLRKGGLAGRIWETLADDVKALRQRRDEKARQNVAAQKFSLGDEKADKESRKPPEHIPWGYARSRVRAMAVDPERLYTYWEVTDEAIALARAQLRPGGDSGWLNLRVYDTTGRLFDGTNAHGYFDHRVDRGDRQWFFTVGRLASEAFVEIGMKSYEGVFVKMARSGRVVFPRREPVLSAEPEWLTVLPSTGEAMPAGGVAPWPPSGQQRT